MGCKVSKGGIPIDLCTKIKILQKIIAFYEQKLCWVIKGWSSFLKIKFFFQKNGTWKKKCTSNQCVIFRERFLKDADLFWHRKLALKVYPILYPSLGNLTTHIAILYNKNGQKTMHRISYFQRQKQFFHTFVCCKKILLDIFFSENVYSITISLFSLY